MNALEQAIDAAGGVGKLAEKLGIWQTTVSNWKARGQVPVERCAAIEAATNGAVTRHDLRPDIFGPVPELADAA